MSRVLVVYYSYANGNTEKIALKLAESFKADICGIDPVEPYSEDYNTTVKIGKEEVDNGVCREIQPLKYDVKDYDVIIVGTPTWWYTMAPVVRTFLKENDFSNKTVIPFMTHAGWPGTVIKDMTALAKGATVKYPMEIQFDSEGGSNCVTTCKEINDWIESIKL